MPINRPTWYRLTQKNHMPSLPCPQCATGKLKLVDSGYSLEEPAYSSSFRNHEDWDPENVVERWSARLRCDESACGEVVHMIGDTEAVDAEEEIGGQMYYGREDVLRIRAVYPAPPLFRPSQNVPYRVRQQLRLAFQMYWTDVSACVARLRTAVEALLDHQKVPKERLLTSGKNAGKMHRMNLQERIDSFASGAVHHAQLQGLRHIGNLGTHGTDDVDDEDLFDAIDVLEFVLTGIYDTHSINAKAAKLKSKQAGA